ncbi:MAG: hypothetical protein LBJ97_01395 [Mycoplasmataceae bacterium]|jgi:archaellum component FlaC|nr:hypothetical protein [Mycoplasmataceae bacterium]
MKNKTISTNYQVTKSDHDPVKRGDNVTLTRKAKSRSPDIDVIINKPPRKSLEERVANVIKATVPSMIQEALEPVVNRLDKMDSRLDKMDNRLDKIEFRLEGHDEFNKVVKDYMESHP